MYDEDDMYLTEICELTQISDTAKNLSQSWKRFFGIFFLRVLKTLSGLYAGTGTKSH